MNRISRRRFTGRILQGFSGLPLARRLWSQAANNDGPLEPEVRSFDLSLLDDWLTPNELFFVREHFPAPALSSSDWELSIAGAVDNALKISYDDLLRQPRKDLAVTLECAGNPRGGGLISNAEWTGVSLAPLLEKARPHPEAQTVRLSGADGDSRRNAYYHRSIPLAKAMHSDTLLAYQMNGTPLPKHHGFPVRAVVPGWYGMDSVKWLRKVEVLPGEDTSEWMTKAYLRQIRSAPGGRVTSEPLTAMQVKAAFSRPLDRAVLVGRHFVVRGAAWAGEHRVRQVEVSTDGGNSWETARLLAIRGREPRPYAWVFWEYPWSIPAPGKYELAVRAGDDQGRTQPAERSANRLDVNELHHYQRVRCAVV